MDFIDSLELRLSKIKDLTPDHVKFLFYQNWDNLGGGQSESENNTGYHPMRMRISWIPVFGKS